MNSRKPLLGGLVWLLGFSATGLSGCSVQNETKPVLLAGNYVSAETLQHGKKVFHQNCRNCHGEFGEGNGPASVGMRPSPPDLTQGRFRFAAVPMGYQLPRDEELMRIICSGLDGTNMVHLDLTVESCAAVIQYIKTLSDTWIDPDSKRAPVYRPTTDPYEGNPAVGIALGKEVYHDKAGCWGCHPSYLSREELEGVLLSSGRDPSTIRSDENLSLKLPSVPPDFTWDGVKISRGPEGVYRTVTRGLMGSLMPGYEGVLEDYEIWALSHYVDSLVEKDGS